MRFLRTSRNIVPPSAPFIPLSARIPNTVFISTTPPLSCFAVPPTVSIASPNCATEVLDFCEVFANWSVKFSSWVVSSPSAAILSVARSEAYAKSIPPADARFNTVGKALAAFSAS